VSWYQTSKTNLDFTGARDSEWQWYQLGIHELTRTAKFWIRTPPLSVVGLVIFTKVVNIGGFFKFTALPLQDQTMHANESCHFCNSCALVL